MCIYRYFEWIQTIQHILQTWNCKIKLKQVTIDDILLYASCFNEVAKICAVLHADTLVVDSSLIDELKLSLEEQFENLNILLLKYIPGNRNYLNLLSLVNRYGVYLPTNVLSCVEEFVVFPGDTRKEHQLVQNSLRFKKFMPHDSDIVLRVTRNFHLDKLSCLVNELSSYFDIPDLDVLVYFNLNPSVVVDTYITYNIDQINTSTSSSSKRIPYEFGKKVSVSVLQASLCETKMLLEQIVLGKTTYEELIAHGALNLENLDIDKEFTLIEKYFASVQKSFDCRQGLDGVKSLLELFQYSKHVGHILNTCQQYKLDRCLKDEDLLELQRLVEPVESEQSRSKTSLIQATDSMKHIKQLLCFERRKCSNYLEVFPAVADCVEFFQFLHEEYFYDDHGRARFHEQVQLVTAQLQHEEYNERVLNHLVAAYNVMLPFLHSEQSFEDLMTKVASLDVTSGLKQLVTVRENIMLIQLWFSRTKVSFCTFV